MSASVRSVTEAKKWQNMFDDKITSTIALISGMRQKYFTHHYHALYALFNSDEMPEEKALYLSSRWEERNTQMSGETKKNAEDNGKERLIRLSWWNEMLRVMSLATNVHSQTHTHAHACAVCLSMRGCVWPAIQSMLAPLALACLRTQRPIRVSLTFTLNPFRFERKFHKFCSEWISLRIARSTSPNNVPVWFHFVNCSAARRRRSFCILSINFFQSWSWWNILRSFNDCPRACVSVRVWASVGCIASTRRLRSVDAASTCIGLSFARCDAYFRCEASN